MPHLQTQPPFVADVVLLAVEMYKGVSLFATVGLALKLSLILIKVKPLKYEPIEQTSANADIMIIKQLLMYEMFCDK